QILIQKENKKENTRAESKKRGPGVRVKGMDNLLVRIAKCCNPVPGDEIVGYITKGRGVSVHRKDCPNVKTEEAKERYIEVEWNQRQDFKNQYQVDLEITGFNRRGLVNEVLHEIYEAKTNISYVNAKVNQNKIAIIEVTVLIRNTKHLRKIVDRIKRISDVYSVVRTIH